MITLGDPHPELPVKLRDNSVFMLIDGMLFLSIIAIFVVAYILSVKSAEKSYQKYCALKRFSNQKNALQELAGSSFTVLGLAPAVIMLIIFVVVPLVFFFSFAFTNYSAPTTSLRATPLTGSAFPTSRPCFRAEPTGPSALAAWPCGRSFGLLAPLSLATLAA